MVSGGGSQAFVVIALFVASIFVLLLLRHYLRLRSTPAYLLVPVFLALALPISIILLVPIDLASNLRPEDGAPRGIILPERVLLVWWRISYWLTFCLTWFILPLLGEYVDSGYRTPRDKVIDSLKKNIKYYLMVLGCIIAGLVYVIIQIGFNLSSLKSLAMALAYVIGLVQAIYLMGHGLVVIPRNLIKNANISNKLRSLQTQAPKVHEKMEDSITELAELEQQVQALQARKNGLSRDQEEWIEDLVDISPEAYTRLSSTASLPPTSAPRLPAVITDRYLADLGRRLARARHKRIRYVSSWSYLVQSAADAQAVLDSRASHRLSFGGARPRSSSQITSHLPSLPPTLTYHLHTHVLPTLRLVLGALLALASAAIVWSELVKHFAPSLSLISLTILPHPSAPTLSFPRQLLAFLYLSYMSLATLHPLSSIKVWGNRALVRRNTYLESATWYATQTAKLTVPLTFNFLTFIGGSEDDGPRQQTVFYRFLGRFIELTPLGMWFDFLFPMFILLPVGAALFNLYARLGRWAGSWGMEYFALEDDEAAGNDPAVALYGSGGWREGKALIERELMGRASLAGADTPLERDATRNGGARAAPSLYVPPAQQGSRSGSVSPARSPSARGGGGGSASQAAASSSRLGAATRAAREREEQEREDEGGFFGDFAHRVRNTLDGVEAPEWARELSKRPRWMGGDEEGEDRGAGGSSAGGAGAEGVGGQGSGGGPITSGLNRWFGRGGDGRVRL